MNEVTSRTELDVTEEPENEQVEKRWMNKGMERKTTVEDTFSFHLQMKCSTMSWMFDDKRQLVLYHYTFFFFYISTISPLPQWNCQLDWCLYEVEQADSTSTALLHFLHWGIFTQMSSKVPVLQPVNIFTKIDHYNQKTNPCRKNAWKMFNDRTVIWTLTLRHAICFLLPWDTQWIVTLCVL